MSDADTLTAAFAAADAGDPTQLVDLYADDMTWAGFTTDGTQRVFSKGEFLEAFGILAELDESRNEVTRTETTPEGVVIAWIQAYRRLARSPVRSLVGCSAWSRSIPSAMS